MKKEFFSNEVREVMDFMFRLNEGRTLVFVNDFQGIRRPEFLKKDGLGDQEACGFAAEDGEQFVLQGVYLRLSTGIEAQLRVAGDNGRDEVVKRLNFDELFDDDVVIGTTNECLHYLVPVCSSKMELAQYILGLREYVGKGEYSSWNDEYIRNAEKLAKFLYKHNPDKKQDVLDELADL